MEDNGKKRKRHGGDDSRKSKRVVSQAQEIRVSLVDARDDVAVPIVVSTPGLSNLPSVPLQPYMKPRRDVPRRSGGGSAIAAHELLLHSSEHSRLDYTAREDESGGTDNLLRHYVGVYDAATGKLEVTEARKLTVRGLVRSQQAPLEALADRSKVSMIRELRNDLGQTFGTKKARKAIRDLTENAISPEKSARQTSPGGTQHVKVDSVTSAMLEAISEATAGASTRVQLQAVADEAKPRPVADAAASDPKDVYTAVNLVGIDMLKIIHVREWQDAAKNSKEIMTKSKYVSRRINKAAKNVQKLKVLRYLLWLLEFRGSAKGRPGRKRLPQRTDLRAAMQGAPEAVVEEMRRKFSSRGEVSKFLDDLMITHACALALIIDDAVVDVFDLKEDLQLEAAQMSQYFKEVGCLIAPASEKQRLALGLDKAVGAQRKFAKLKVPLEYPKVKFARKR